MTISVVEGAVEVGSKVEGERNKGVWAEVEELKVGSGIKDEKTGYTVWEGENNGLIWKLSNKPDVIPDGVEPMTVWAGMEKRVVREELKVTYGATEYWLQKLEPQKQSEEPLERFERLGPGGTNGDVGQEFRGLLASLKPVLKNL